MAVQWREAWSKNGHVYSRTQFTATKAMWSNTFRKCYIKKIYFKPKCVCARVCICLYVIKLECTRMGVSSMSNARRVFLMRTVDLWCVRYWRRHGRMRLSNHNNKQPAFCTGSSFNHSVWFRNERIVLVSTELASFEVLFSALSTPG